jgi:hypothetical protein
MKQLVAFIKGIPAEKFYSGTEPVNEYIRLTTSSWNIQTTAME